MAIEHCRTRNKKERYLGIFKKKKKSCFIFYGRINLILLVKLQAFARPLGHSVSKV